MRMRTDMSPLTIRAVFPLGVFQGHRADGSPDRLPDTARLFSALVNAAGQGSEAIAVKGRLEPSSESTAALSWLEKHPPTMIRIPNHVPVSPDRRPDAYRKTGTVQGPKKSPAMRIGARQISTGTAIDDCVGWFWADAPSEVQETVGRLCADVSCLGEDDSPVILTLDQFVPTHELVASTQQLRPTGLAVRTPGPGRLDELIRAHHEAFPPKMPSAAQDSPSFSEMPRGSRVPTEGLRVLRYKSPTPPPADSPWPLAMLLPLSAHIALEDGLTWCVAMHRMLISRLGDGAPAIVTGHYARGASQPANRVAVQYLPPTLLSHRAESGDFPHGAIALLLPASIAAEDRGEIVRALNSPRLGLWSSAGRVTLGTPLRIDASQFWPTPQPGWRRQWRTLDGMVPETRRQPRHELLGAWGFPQSALLSVGHVFREELALTRANTYWETVSVVTDRGVQILGTHLIPDSEVSRYVHKVPRSIGVVQPYSAQLDLADLVNDRALLALGQARHLGGGLLVPMDSPEVS
ncbi:type I-U CRISPR-associated protein Cas5/Cas6 [Propionibacterium freudenreichii]|nr:type I-U CRISPR-associated protein Cas5/Cas6 [Propionibacterium freudenreichii]MCT3008901.1 type I-U CRISPR-associated protein Cas5/Cas6 [Propionibacterium freudenreichii]CEP27826.1 Hypothetical protein PFCIRM138_06815 [Propionibacterium freudenreichii subsp. freudenreichii]